MTTDQSHSESRVSPTRNFGVIDSAESSDDAAQSARMWNVRGGLGDMPALQLRLRHPRSGNPDLCPSSPARRAHAGPSVCQSPPEQLLMSAQEDISRLNEILRAQQSTAVMCGLDGVILSLDTITNPIGGGHHGAAVLDPPPGTSSFSTPIFDAEGRALASLDIIQADTVRSESSEQLLHALADSAARAISERWFRLVNRRHCVVAAMRRPSNKSSMRCMATSRA